MTTLVARSDPFVQRNDYRGNFAPGYMPLNTWSGGVGFDTVDHVVGNVDSGGMLDWVAFYEKIFGFHVFQGFDARALPCN